VFFHRRIAAHAIEHHAALTVFFNDFVFALIVTGQHSAKHDKIRAATESLGQTSRHSAATISTNKPLQPMRGISTFNNGRELRIAYACHLARGADTARPDPDLNDISSVEDQLLDHLTGHHVPGHNCGLRHKLADLFDIINEWLGIAVSDIDTNLVYAVWLLFQKRLKLF